MATDVCVDGRRGAGDTPPPQLPPLAVVAAALQDVHVLAVHGAISGRCKACLCDLTASASTHAMQPHACEAC